MVNFPPKWFFIFMSVAALSGAAGSIAQSSAKAKLHECRSVLTELRMERNAEPTWTKP
jgi:hypothetical protein